jgi:penicillin-binding protein 2
MTEKEIYSWQTNTDRLNMKKEDVKYNARELFKYLRDEKFKIDPSLSDKQAYAVMTLRYEILINNWNFSTGGTVALAWDVSMDTVSELEERRHEFPGIFTTIEPVREYIDSYDVAHVLGYIRRINSSQYDSLKDEGYDNNDLIGQTGVEKTAERYLRGKNGKMSIELDDTGRLHTQECDCRADAGQRCSADHRQESPEGGHGVSCQKHRKDQERQKRTQLR